ncbi:hypothetical protein DFJ77DRAFT_513265 [Powellomyces hirtus]|nr:hypothetical protein DFJ77DRAFT_513265 [Powellomyces hirtus]
MQHEGLSEYAKLLRSLSQQVQQKEQSSDDDDTDVDDPITYNDMHSGMITMGTEQVEAKHRDSGFASTSSRSASGSVGSFDDLDPSLFDQDLSDGSFKVYDDEEDDAWYTPPPTQWHRRGRRPSTLSVTVDDLLKQLDATLGETATTTVTTPATTHPAPIRKYPSSPPRATSIASPAHRKFSNPYPPSRLPTLQIATSQGDESLSTRQQNLLPPLTAPLPLSPTLMSPPTPISSAVHRNNTTQFPFPTMSQEQQSGIRAGYVQKQSQSLFTTSWKKRYLVLDRETLFLFRTHQSLQKDLTGILKLASDSSVRVSENGMWVLEVLGCADMFAKVLVPYGPSVTSATESSVGAIKKMWIVKCEGKDDMMKWLKDIRSCIKEIAEAATRNKGKKTQI